jgi:hypothetical protein
MAPERGDIIWKNLTVRPKNKRCRCIGVNGVVMLVLFFFTTPITMISGLLTVSQPSTADEADHTASSEEARKFLYDVATFGDDWPWLLRKWVREYIPTWSLLATTLTVLTVMEIFTTFEKYNLKSEVQKAIGWKTYLFLVANIFLLPSILLDSVDGFVDLILGGGNLFELLSKVHSEGNGSFYTCIVVQFWLTSTPYQLHRLHEKIVEYFGAAIAVTVDEKLKAALPRPHEYGFHYGYQLLIFTITLVYSADSPIIVVCGLGYFSLKHCVDKYNILYVRPHTYGNTNMYTGMILGFVIIAILIFQAALGGFFLGRISEASIHGFKRSMLVTLSILPFVYTWIYYGGFVRKLFFSDADLPAWCFGSNVTKIENMLGIHGTRMKQLHGLDGDGMISDDEDDEDDDDEADDSGGGVGGETLNGSGPSIRFPDLETVEEEAYVADADDEEAPRELSPEDEARMSGLAGQDDTPGAKTYRFNRRRQRWATAIDLNKMVSSARARARAARFFLVTIRLTFCYRR